MSETAVLEPAATQIRTELCGLMSQLPPAKDSLETHVIHSPTLAGRRYDSRLQDAIQCSGAPWLSTHFATIIDFPVAVDGNYTGTMTVEVAQIT